jgi:hypothetical protein
VEGGGGRGDWRVLGGCRLPPTKGGLSEPFPEPGPEPFPDTLLANVNGRRGSGILWGVIAEITRHFIARRPSGCMWGLCAERKRVQVGASGSPGAPAWAERKKGWLAPPPFNLALCVRTAATPPFRRRLPWPWPPAPSAARGG